MANLSTISYDNFLNLVYKGDVKGDDLINLCNVYPNLKRYCTRNNEHFFRILLRNQFGILESDSPQLDYMRAFGGFDLTIIGHYDNPEEDAKTQTNIDKLGRQINRLNIVPKNITFFEYQNMQKYNLINDYSCAIVSRTGLLCYMKNIDSEMIIIKAPPMKQVVILKNYSSFNEMLDTKVGIGSREKKEHIKRLYANKLLAVSQDGFIYTYNIDEQELSQIKNISDIQHVECFYAYFYLLKNNGELLRIPIRDIGASRFELVTENIKQVSGLLILNNDGDIYSMNHDITNITLIPTNFKVKQIAFRSIGVRTRLGLGSLLLSEDGLLYQFRENDDAFEIYPFHHEYSFKSIGEYRIINENLPAKFAAITKEGILMGILGDDPITAEIEVLDDQHEFVSCQSYSGMIVGLSYKDPR